MTADEVLAPDAEATTSMWSEFTAVNGAGGEPDDVFAFGDSRSMADELALLILHGPKRATAGMVEEFGDDEPLPRVGGRSIFVFGDGRPAGVIETTDVRIGPLSSADDQFAWDEGEGDRTLAYWMDEHERYFRRRCLALGMPFSQDLQICFERFELVWPPPA